MLEATELSLLPLANLTGADPLEPVAVRPLGVDERVEGAICMSCSLDPMAGLLCHGLAIAK